MQNHALPEASPKRMMWSSLLHGTNVDQLRNPAKSVKIL